jgi:GTPase SAR1 family protein
MSQKQCCVDSKKKDYKFCPQCGKQLFNQGVNITIAVCGQGAVGKSNITLAYIKNEFGMMEYMIYSTS